MTQGTVYNLGNLFLYATVVPLTLFVVLYGFRSPWRALPVGRTIMYLCLSLLSVIVYSITFVYLGEYPLRAWVRLVLYSSVFFTFCRMTYTLLKLQRATRQFIEDEKPPDPLLIDIKDSEKKLR